MDNRFAYNNSIELFCGTGGLALGLEKAGFHHNALYEWDKDSCNNIRTNISYGYPAVADWNVHQIDVRNVSYNGMRGVINLVSGGPPCQPFSLGGKAGGYDDKRDMFPEAVRAVREIRPEVFVFENVKGLLRPSFSEYFDYIIRQLVYPDVIKGCDESWQEHKMVLDMMLKEKAPQIYNVSYRMLNAADYGVPQLRYRVFIVGFRADLQDGWGFPIPTQSKEGLIYEKWITGEYWRRHGIISIPECPYSKEKLADVQKRVEDGKVARAPWKTVRDAIGDLPEPMSDEAKGIFNHEYRAGARPYAGHSGSLMDEPSKTIKAGAHGVPGGENMLVLDDGSVRYYTVRECARIQTFPDEYRFFVSWTESIRQIGNAVPVKLAEAVGRSIMDHVEKCHGEGRYKEHPQNCTI